MSEMLVVTEQYGAKRPLAETGDDLRKKPYRFWLACSDRHAV
jgi:hypothetical protein